MTITKNFNLNLKHKKQAISEKSVMLGICVAILTASVVCEAADQNSVGIIQKVIKSITDLIKTDGKIGLQIISAAAGSIAAAKTVSWQPLVIGAGGAGIVEIIFQAIG